ncbi:MAG: SDR family oxidoreductase [Anaerolineae bacterium]|jgi:3-oxoacyl-[acyl-carrier protein] reductase|nr:SDR family oxidoreductase [Anaerolineae bacterium]MBT4309765.1 SDR family oxidoreductase [Anaerolineae bacterium]MBT4457986.1 SDR family oxidoreductase [Anaerolineae bacterium]MBT4841338.1 SDR family oxidoreductase [Anaerolineae bacterium]MBT6061745.1 SDR family oxidoreductase [Anaerolineae bacterium]
MDKTRFQNRVCLITGAGSEAGIGFAAAQTIGLAGAQIAITSTTNRIEQRASSLRFQGIKTNAYITDLMDRVQVRHLVESVLADFGRIDILINNAGMVQVGQDDSSSEMAEMAFTEWDTSIARNLHTCFNVTRTVLPIMINQQYGRIVNVSSVTGPLVSNPGSTSYGAAKAAMIGMSRSLAIEVATKGIIVNNVLPGWIGTGSQAPEEAIAAQYTPMKRAGTPGEVADLIAYLASDEATYITGQEFIVDGGNCLQEYKGPSELYY